MTTLNLDPDDRELLRDAVAALQTIAAALSATLSDEPETYDDSEGEVANDDGDAWRPRKGGRAMLTGDPVFVNRLFVSEGEIAADVVFDDGSDITTWASALSEPPA
jgi:hypothetical protein